MLKMSIELVRNHYPNGERKSEWHWNYNSEGRGTPTGDYISWYESGARESEAVDVNLDDTLYMCTEWYENGNKKSKGACTNYTWEVGLWTKWHENGKKKSEGFYKGNDWKYLETIDDIDEYANEFDSTPIGEWSFWHNNGQLACTGVRKDWGGDGLWRFLDEDGNKIHEREYKDNELLSVWVNLRKDGCSDSLIKKFKQYIFN